MLSDSNLGPATALGLTFKLPPELVALYGRVGNDLPVLNGNGRWVLPVPVTYVIGHSGQIVFAHADADYRERAEPSVVLAVIEQVRRIS